MTNLECTLDYETRSEIDLPTVGAIRYAAHHSTSIFCVGYKINEQPVKLWIPERAPMPNDLFECFKHGRLIAHNAAFERAITKYTLIRYPLLTEAQKRILSAIPIAQWKCTAAKAAASSLPRKLEFACKVMKTLTQKDMLGSKILKKYWKPRKPTKGNPNKWCNHKDELQRIYYYCIQDVKAEFELDKSIPDLPPIEQNIWELDQKINERGVLIDVPTVKTVLTMMEEEKKNIQKSVQDLSNGYVESVNQQAKLLKWLNAEGAGMTNLKAPTIVDKLEESDVPAPVREMLEYRQSGSKTSTAKYVTMLSAVDSDHRARELLLYCGATPTARWSGKRIQPQNFPKPKFKDFNSDEAIKIIQTGDLNQIRKRYGKTRVMDVLASAARGMIIASPGKELFCADWSSIEARLAFWFADHVEGVRAFAEDKKLYEEMAASIFGVPIHKVTKESLERFVGKESILGCQYGMGWVKFLMQCHSKGMKMVTPAIAKRAVAAYRKDHHFVPEMWGNIERAVIRAVKNPGTVYELHKVAIYKKGKFLNIVLPSGRPLRYFNPRISQKQLPGGRMVPSIHVWTYHNQYGWIETDIWGGIFMNHICQGTARDLMALGMLNIEEAGYDFLLSVHDEGVSEKTKGTGSIEEYIKLMVAKPKWAKGAPLKAEGWIGQRYRK